MAKRNFALVVLLLLGGMFSTPGAIAQTLDFDDGCAVLNEIVRQSVLSAALFDEGYPGDNYGSGYAGAQSCSNTAAAVSTAFRASLIQMNIVTRWSLLQSDGGIICLSHDLSTCYPFADPMGPPLQPSDLAFIQNSWQTVRDGVMAQMPWGSGSDMSFFDGQALTTRLSGTVNGPLNTGFGSIGDWY